jgi:hypothetical protein
MGRGKPGSERMGALFRETKLEGGWTKEFVPTASDVRATVLNTSLGLTGAPLDRERQPARKVKRSIYKKEKET